LSKRRTRVAVAVAAVAAVIILVVALNVQVESGENEGAPRYQLPEKLPKPAAIRVAVLPFYDAASQEELARAVTAEVALLFDRYGFSFASRLERDPSDLAEILAKTQQAVRNEKGIGGRRPLSIEDAARIGRKLGANWVVGGEISNLNAQRTCLGLRRRAMATVEFNVADVTTGKLVFARRIRGLWVGGALIPRDAIWYERRAALWSAHAAYLALWDELGNVSQHMGIYDYSSFPFRDVDEYDVQAVEARWGKLAPSKAVPSSGREWTSHQ